jgi:hypothetical protein
MHWFLWAALIIAGTVILVRLSASYFTKRLGRPLGKQRAAERDGEPF